MGVERLLVHYPNTHDARTLLRSFAQLSGELRSGPDGLQITLDPPADPSHRRALRGLCSDLNQPDVVGDGEREKVARRVRDNLSYLKRNGNLLGVIPQGYRRVDGRIVEDPEAAPIIRQILTLYATGQFSVRSLADHLNSHGVRPVRGPGKVNHNRPAAVILTGDVIKDILKKAPHIAGRSCSTAR